MGKSTISMAIFNSYVSHYQRVCTTDLFPICILLRVTHRIASQSWSHSQMLQKTMSPSAGPITIQKNHVPRSTRFFTKWQPGVVMSSTSGNCRQLPGPRLPHYCPEGQILVMSTQFWKFFDPLLAGAKRREFSGTIHFITSNNNHPISPFPSIPC